MIQTGLSQSLQAFNFHFLTLLPVNLHAWQKYIIGHTRAGFVNAFLFLGNVCHQMRKEILDFWIKQLTFCTWVGILPTKVCTSETFKGNKVFVVWKVESYLDIFINSLKTAPFFSNSVRQDNISIKC